MRTIPSLLAAAVILAAAGCKDSTAPLPLSITLTSAQATALVGKAQTISATSTELAWLADSIDVILKAGTSVYRISVTVDGHATTYYAVSLVRQVLTTNSFTTFHFIAFDNVDTPTDFVLVNGYVASADATPPTELNGPIGAPAAFAHKVHVSGATVTDWVGTAGTAAFELIPLEASCGSSANVTCNASTMNTNFNITNARPDANTADVHTFSAVGLTIPGVLLTFN